MSSMNMFIRTKFNPDNRDVMVSTSIWDQRSYKIVCDGNFPPYQIHKEMIVRWLSDNHYIGGKIVELEHSGSEDSYLFKVQFEDE